MSMPILALLLDAGPDLYYDRSVRITFETHMAYLRQHPDAKWVAVEPIQAVKYAGDLNGLLLNMGFNAEYHHVIQRVNDLASPLDLTEDCTALLIPPIAEVKHIVDLANTVSVKPR